MAGDISRQNGKKGGRKKAAHTIATEAGRALIATMIEENLTPIITALISKAKKGDVPAIKELFDRGWGKPVQAISGPDGGPIRIQSVEISFKK